MLWTPTVYISCIKHCSVKDWSFLIRSSALDKCSYLKLKPSDIQPCSPPALRFRADFQLAKINVSFLTALDLCRLTWAEKPGITLLSWCVCVCLGDCAALFMLFSNPSTALGSFQEQEEQASWLFILSSSRPQCMVWWELVFSATENSIIVP